MAFSPDGRRLAIACSYEHDNALLNGSPEDQGKVMLLIKETVNEDCKVSCLFPGFLEGQSGTYTPDEGESVALRGTS